MAEKLDDGMIRISVSIKENGKIRDHTIFIPKTEWIGRIYKNTVGDQLVKIINHVANGKQD